MAVWIAPDSVEGKERARWDRPTNQYWEDPNTHEKIPGLKNAGYVEYPKCLYKAGRPKMAGVEITESKTVRDDYEERIAVGQGWCRTQEEAIQLVHSEHTLMAKLAANRAYQEQSMSEQARAEAAAYESETIQHVAEIPEKKRPGRPRKTVEPA